MTVERSNGEHFELLFRDALAAVLSGGRLAVLGQTEWSQALISALRGQGLVGHVAGIFADAPIPVDGVESHGIGELSKATFTHLVVASDEHKEDLLLSALPHLVGCPRVIVSGYGHLKFCDPLFDELEQSQIIPSLANGYPNTLIHIYQCLASAHRRGLGGIVVEFGMFKGGTTMFMSKVIERIGANWKVVGFDSFDGFPPRRSPLDMYDHPGCAFRDFATAHRMFEGRNVELVKGDIVETCQRVAQEEIVLAFVDTDNYTPAREIIRVCRDRVVPGGAFVFDHFTGVDRFRYTLGERIAAKALLDDSRFLNLHSTGVFLRMEGSETCR